MQINPRLLRTLAVIGAASLAVLFGTLMLVVATGYDVPTPLIVILSVTAFASLLWLWVYWLVFFHRSSQRRELWLCYCLPYLYSSYKTVAFLHGVSQERD